MVALPAELGLSVAVNFTVEPVVVVVTFKNPDVPGTGRPALSSTVNAAVPALNCRR